MKMSKLSGILALTLAIGFAGAATAGDLELTKRVHETILDEDRGYMGVALSIVTNIDDRENDGVYVQRVRSDSPAEAAGLAEDDRLVTVNGVSVVDFETLARSMESTRPEQTIAVTVVREGVEQAFSVQLAALPAEHDSRWGVVLDEKRPYLGVHIEELNSQLAQYFDVEGGILVTQVIDESPADDAGMLAGDIVVAVEGKPVSDRHSLQQAMSDLEPGDEVAVGIQRKGSSLTLYVEAGSYADSSLKINLRELHEHLKMIVVGESEHELTVHREHAEGLHELSEDDD